MQTTSLNAIGSDSELRAVISLVLTQNEHRVLLSVRHTHVISQDAKVTVFRHPVTPDYLIHILTSNGYQASQNYNNNNKQICIAPKGRNFRGAGARQRVSEQRKKRKPEKRNVLSLSLKTATESLR